MMDPVGLEDVKESGGDSCANENVELENPQVQPTAKKRNRRKERSRKKG